MTFVPVNLKKLEKEEKRKKISKWQSKEGWIYPDVKTTLQSNEHPRKLDQASIDKLYEVFESFFKLLLVMKLIYNYDWKNKGVGRKSSSYL